ncbi:SDR family oxidoreductase [Pontiellaceae bacterium B12227]|nr:SDR family oxidoreductase [Pontiellaceae bacterium B12227]
MRTILVTGASSGIGLETVDYLSKRNFHVFACIRNKTDAETGIIAERANIDPLLLDVTNRESINQAFSDVIRQISSKGLSGLVCNAGIPLAGPIEQINIDKFSQLLDVNVLGNMRVIQQFLPLIRITRGRIVFISSISGRIALPFQGPYSASKFALEAVADALRVELKPWDISVSIIQPGNVKSKIREKALKTLQSNLATLDENETELYKPVYDLATGHAGRKSIEPFHVAKKIERALSSRHPKARYTVGIDTRILSLIAQFPTFLRDRILCSKLPPYGH